MLRMLRTECGVVLQCLIKSDNRHQQPTTAPLELFLFESLCRLPPNLPLSQKYLNPAIPGAAVVGVVVSNRLVGAATVNLDATRINPA